MDTAKQKKKKKKKKKEKKMTKKIKLTSLSDCSSFLFLSGTEGKGRRAEKENVSGARRRVRGGERGQNGTG